MKKHDIKSYVRLNKKKMFIGLLTSIVTASNHTKCILSSSQKCMTQPTLTDLHPNEYSRGYITIHLRLIQIDMSELVKLLMTYSIKYVFQTKQNI